MKKVTIPLSHHSSDDLDIFRQQEIERLSKDKFFQAITKELEVTLEESLLYVDLFMDYCEDAHYCEQCPGFNQCHKANRHLQFALVRKDEHIERTLRHCPIMQRIRTTDKSFLVRDFSDDWCGRFLSDTGCYDLSEERRPFIKKMVGIITSKSSTGIYLYGNPRIGKSYLISLFAQSLIKNNPGRYCCFLDCPTRIRQLNDLSFMNKEQFNATLEMYMNVDYLVLDDFGDEYKNDYIRDMIIYPLLSYRLKEKKPTYFTSHYSLKQIKVMYGDKLASKIKSNQLCELIRTIVEEESHLEGISVY